MVVPNVIRLLFGEGILLIWLYEKNFNRNICLGFRWIRSIKGFIEFILKISFFIKKIIHLWSIKPYLVTILNYYTVLVHKTTFTYHNFILESQLLSVTTVFNLKHDDTKRMEWDYIKVWRSLTPNIYFNSKLILTQNSISFILCFFFFVILCDIIVSIWQMCGVPFIYGKVGIAGTNWANMQPKIRAWAKTGPHRFMAI